MNDSATRLMVQARRETIISTDAREQAHCCAIVEQLHLNTDSHEEIQRRATGRRFALLALLAVTMMSGSAGEGPA